MNREEEISKFDEELRQYINEQDFVKIYRTVTEGEANIDGFILQMSKNFLLIQNEVEFYLDGYVIIRKDEFDSIRSSEIEQFQKNILDKEGIIKSHYGLYTEISLQSWEDIFIDLKQNGYFVIVECENLEEPTFTIGEISEISDTSAGIKYFSPTGIIDKKPTEIKYDEITIVKFGNRYTELYSKYLHEQN